MTAGPAAIALIEAYEGFSPNLYNCPAHDCTIGYGHKVHTGPIDGRAAEQPYAKGITRERAELLLKADAALAAREVQQSVHVTLTQHQFGC